MKAIITRNLPDAPAPTKAVRIDNWNRTLIAAIDARQAAEKRVNDKTYTNNKKDA